MAPVRPEQRIAVVSHAGFIRHTLSAFARGLSGAAAEALEREFLNCELRTVVRGWRQVFSNLFAPAPGGPSSRLQCYWTVKQAACAHGACAPLGTAAAHGAC